MGTHATREGTPIFTPWRMLPIRWRPEPPLSDDELFEFCVENRELRIERTREGEIIIMSPAGSETGRRNAALVGRLFLWAEKDGTGLAFDSSAGFTLPNGASRAPDASWIRRTRWEALSVEQREKFAPICPDLVVELRSPSDRLADVEAKLEEYVANGALLGWLIDPIDGKVRVYRPGRPTETLDRPRSVSGEPELPGFTLELKGILD